jgi:arsenite-transporting ATPase
VRLVLYTGKGGVGKTTTAASTAACAAARGLRTLVVSADAAHSLGDVLGQRLGPDPMTVWTRARAGAKAKSKSKSSSRSKGKLDAIELDVRVETARHWDRIQEYLVTLFLHQGVDAVVAEELALLPGAEEIVTLLAVERAVKSDAYDLVVVDCAPTDAALRIATLPEVTRSMVALLLPILETLTGVAVPIAAKWLPFPLPDAKVFAQADELLGRRFGALQKLLTDPRTSVRLVMTPERMVIDEARRLYTELTLFEIGCDAVVLNRLLPESVGEQEFFRDWVALQAERRAEVEAAFAPLPLLGAPLEEDEVTGLEALTAHGEALFGASDPAGVLSDAPRVRFEPEEGGYRTIIPLPLVDPASLDVVKVEEDLVVTVGGRRRSIRLPRRLAPLELHHARIHGGDLVVRLGRKDAAAPEDAA